MHADTEPDLSRSDVFAQAKGEATRIVKTDIRKESFGSVTLAVALASFLPADCVECVAPRLSARARDVPRVDVQATVGFLHTTVTTKP